MKKRKKLTNIGFSSIETNEEWRNTLKLSEVFYALGMVDKYFFWKMTPVFNDKYAQVNIWFTNKKTKDTDIYTSPLTKSLGLLGYYIDLDKVRDIKNDRELYEFVFNLYCSINKLIFHSLTIDFKLRTATSQ